ncbi:RluA family pseudouridine synthase [Candidatus Saccharibacteria bacterium]|nr:RluA family pseudouridine synthase [Candidatus Saccharibacteria bacterium]
MRLDAYLANTHPEFSRATWQKYIEAGYVSINGEKFVKTAPVSEKSKISVRIPACDKKPINLLVLYQDDNVIVINKPIGVLTHSKGALNDEFTVADFIKSRSSLQGTTLQESNRFGIVHRLDRATSGVIIGAKNEDARKVLQKQFAERKAKKTYLAIVEKAPKEPAARIDLPIARDPKQPSCFRIDPKGKSAITDYRTVRIFPDGAALLELKPLTGRTHQLRVHLAYIGSPIVGDPIYNPPFARNDPAKKGRMFLHAAELEITIPGGERKTFTADLSKDFEMEIQKRNAK